jgi:hypothetical protein
LPEPCIEQQWRMTNVIWQMENEDSSKSLSG